MGAAGVTGAGGDAAKAIASSGLDTGTKIALIAVIVLLVVIGIVLIVQKKRKKDRAAADDHDDFHHPASEAAIMAQIGRPTADDWDGRAARRPDVESGPLRPPRTQRESVLQWCQGRPSVVREMGERTDRRPGPRDRRSAVSPGPRSSRGAGSRPRRLRVHAVEEDEVALAGAVDGVSPPRSPYLPPPRSPFTDGQGPRATPPRTPLLAPPPRSPFEDPSGLPSPRSPYVPPLRSPYDTMRSPRGPPRPPRPRESQVDLPPWEPSVYPQMSSREGFRHDMGSK